MTLRSYRIPILIILFQLILFASFAQPGGGGDPGGGQPVPISGIELLVVGGALLGIKALKSARKRKNV